MRPTTENPGRRDDDDVSMKEIHGATTRPLANLELMKFLTRMLDVRKIVSARSRTSPVRVLPAEAMRADSDFSALYGNSDADRVFTKFMTLAAQRYAVGALQVDASVEARTNIDIAVSRWLSVDGSILRTSDDAELRSVVDEIHLESVDVRFRRLEVTRPDGAVLTTYTSGSRSAPPVVLVIPTGMPVELSKGWLSALGRDHFVVTWESRGMFHHDEPFYRMDHSLDAQVADIFAVMDHYGIKAASMMALCVGTISALRAAHTHPSRITRLILGNGFYSLPGCPKTATESQLLQATSTASKSEQAAARLQAMFLEPAFLPVLDRLAHWTMYPYSDAQLLFRYGKLCTALHQAAKESWLPAITQDVLVIAGMEDTVVHPEGSCTVAARLPHATLQKEPGEDHLGVFEAGPKYRESVLQFLQFRSDSASRFSA